MVTAQYQKPFRNDLTKLPDFLLKAIGTEETRKILKDREKGEITDESETSDKGFLPNLCPEKVVLTLIKLGVPDDNR